MTGVQTCALPISEFDDDAGIEAAVFMMFAQRSAGHAFDHGFGMRQQIPHGLRRGRRVDLLIDFNHFGKFFCKRDGSEPARGGPCKAGLPVIAPRYYATVCLIRQ